MRDNALAIAGLLTPKIGGPSVKPYQPDGYWENLNFPPRTYPADTGAAQYRRGLYTWWQRSFVHPSLLAFDAPSREECTAERNRSNIPQQALVLLNDPTYVEAARVFAARILGEAKGSAEQRITWAWQQALQRDPSARKRETLTALFNERLASYRADARAAAELLKVGFAPVPAGLDKTEVAAWTHVARVLAEPARNHHPRLNHESARPQPTSRAAPFSDGPRWAWAPWPWPRCCGPIVATGRGSAGVLGAPPLPQKAKRVIWLTMAGGPSHLETFDPKPKLAEMDGKPMPESMTKGQQLAQLQGQKLDVLRSAAQVREVRQEPDRDLSSSFRTSVR